MPSLCNRGIIHHFHQSVFQTQKLEVHCCYAPPTYPTQSLQIDECSFFYTSRAPSTSITWTSSRIFIQAIGPQLFPSDWWRKYPLSSHHFCMAMMISYPFTYIFLGLPTATHNLIDSRICIKLVRGGNNTRINQNAISHCSDDMIFPIKERLI